MNELAGLQAFCCAPTATKSDATSCRFDIGRPRHAFGRGRSDSFFLLNRRDLKQRHSDVELPAADFWLLVTGYLLFRSSLPATPTTFSRAAPPSGCHPSDSLVGRAVLLLTPSVARPRPAARPAVRIAVR